LQLTCRGISVGYWWYGVGGTGLAKMTSVHSRVL